VTPEEAARENLNLTERIWRQGMVEVFMNATCVAEHHDDCYGVALEHDQHCDCQCHRGWVWLQRLDQRYACRVVRLDDPEQYLGRLQVTDMRTGDNLLDVEVHMMYGAIYGPDVDDVNQWMEACCKAVDGQASV
jgi:hypothetical protein